MYSNFIKSILTATALSPILFSYWLVNILLNYKNMSIYFDFYSIQNVFHGILELLRNHWLLLFFIILVYVCKYLLSNAITTLPIGTIDIKSIKPGDVNFDRILFSYLMPWFKFAIDDKFNDIIVVGFLLCYLIYILLGKSSYHYNIVVRILLGYKNYEIQTKREVTYLMLSKKSIINPNQATNYVYVSDYMIIDVT